MKFAKTAKAVALSAIAGGLVAAPALAHHSSAMYDSSKQTVLTGTVKEFNWTNPHISLVVDVPAGGTATAGSWDIEGGSPNTLIKQGWRKSSFKPGDKVSVVVRPMRNGSTGGIFVNATLADGAKLPQARPSGAPAPTGG